MVAVLKKEFKQYFLTPVGYVYLFLFTAIVSLYFYIYAFGNSGVRYEDTIMYSSWLLIILIPILTMKMFSEEIKSRTDTTLITSPNSIFSIVLGKFLSAFGENGNYKVLQSTDLYTYNVTTGRQIDVVEEAITNAIIDVTLKDRPNIYFLTNEYVFYWSFSSSTNN